MIRKNQHLLNLINCGLDMVLIFISYLFSVWLWLGVYRQNLENPAVQLLGSRTILAAVGYAVVMVVIFYAFRLYGSFRFTRIGSEIFTLIQANALGILLLTMGLYFSHLIDFSRGVLALFFITSSLLLILKRVVLRTILQRLRMLGYNQKHVLIVGNGSLAQKYADTLRSNRQYGLNIMGYLAASPREGIGEHLGRYEDLPRLLNGPQVDEVVVALEPHEIDFLVQVISWCEKGGVRTSIIPFYNDYIPARPTVEIMGPVKLLNIRSIPLDDLFNACLKRSLDIVGSLVLILLTSPIMLIAAIGVRLSGPGPILFRQQRVGLNKQLFTMYKFRSMRVNDTQQTGWSTNQDNRKTLFGSLIRKTSIDELPQFFNVLKGDMSLIGPRPEIPYFVEQFKETIPLYMVKHQVRPGITGWAQVHGLRGDTSIEERIRYDLWYIENWSVWLDVKILFMTIFGGLVNKEKLNLSKDSK